MPDTSSQSDAVKASLAGAVPPQPRVMGAVNWLGLWTLYKKEVRRFLKVSFQTVAAPVATTLLYMMVFSLAIGVTREAPGGLPFVVFLGPGLIMMGLLNNAFANSSSSLIVAKVQGNTVDFLMPPLSAGELAAAFIGGAITRGVLVAAASAAVIVPFASLPVAHLWAIVFFGVGAAAMLGMAGVIAGVWAEKFDHLAVITNFIIMPLTFLSGTFYSISILPEPFQTISHVNPFFYLIDGFRYGFIGYADGNIAIGVAVTLVINAVLLVACYGVLRSGWRLRT
ncbi:transport permease protein [Glycocaulis albus]|jgi:ABC-2 type transport system permease protein|uniref:Transport permease protein n=1 Tax=Glycocaulis albus TaxID=1382801 RepID=A0ABQ1XNJ0_9PROT|nr:ABC transporter permease [Glycocaulis albus]MBV5258279.1 multidrug ABC transporter permease [Synechococcus moorigangaii CMS01]GGG98676.1 transport permease protein [Glycocaulis albus]